MFAIVQEIQLIVDSDTTVQGDFFFFEAARLSPWLYVVATFLTVDSEIIGEVDWAIEQVVKVSYTNGI